MYIIILLSFMYYYRYDYLFIINNLYQHLKTILDEDYTLVNTQTISKDIYRYSYRNGKSFYYLGENPIIYSKTQIVDSINKSSHKIVKTYNDIILGELETANHTIDALDLVQMLSSPLGNFYGDLEQDYLKKFNKDNIEIIARDYFNLKHLDKLDIKSLYAMDSEGSEYKIL